MDADICSACGDILKIARKVISAGVDIIQLRAKNYSDRNILKIGQVIKELAQKGKILFVLNDRVDLASALDVDGVHLGQDDLPLKDARKILGTKKIIGLSAHSVEEAIEAERQGAEYIAIGPIFPTTAKPKSSPLKTEIIAKIKNSVKTPFVAVGGIKLNNLEQVLASGAQRVAVCRAIIEAKDIVGATKQFRQRLYKETRNQSILVSPEQSEGK